MSVIPVSSLSSSDLAHLGNNVRGAIQSERRQAKDTGRLLSGRPSPEHRPVYSGPHYGNRPQ